MVLDLVEVEVVNEYEMQTQIAHPTVDEMADFILSKIHALDPRRRYMFIEWLCAHSSQAQCVINIRAGLNAWLDSMSAESTAWEYRTIINEINWWRQQDQHTVDRLILEHLERHS